MIEARAVSVQLGRPSSSASSSAAVAQRRTVDNITSAFHRGQVVAIVGRNAAGKTTLLRALAGVIDVVAGEVLWDGRPPRRWSARERAKRVAYVAQRPLVSARFSVRETIELGRYALPPSDQRVQGAIEAFGLAEIQDRIYHELSVGQQQRVALARAWAQVDANGALLLDEPFAAMDLAETDRSATLVRRFVSGGGLAIVVLHDLSLAARIADAVVVLEAGRMALAGPIREVLTTDFLTRHFGVPFRLDVDGIPEPMVGQDGSKQVS